MLNQAFLACSLEAIFICVRTPGHALHDFDMPVLYWTSVHHLASFEGFISKQRSSGNNYELCILKPRVCFCVMANILYFRYLAGAFERKVMQDEAISVNDGLNF